LKRILSIFFLFIFLFQVGGYYIVFWTVAHNAKHDLLRRLDAGAYSSDEAIVLTIPLSLPYPVGEADYERVNGDFQHNGESYKLIKQKLENDTLFVVCIKDHESTKIQAAYADFTKFAHNVPVDNKKAIDFLTKLYKDFRSTEFRILYKSRLLYERTYLAESSRSIQKGVHPIDSPPPDMLF
jgi:hypothetical protein